MSIEIEALLLPLFRRQAKPITAADAHKMLSCKQAAIGVRMTCAEMARKGLLSASHRKSGILYELASVTKTRHESQAIHWTPLKPLAPTVIPIRERGRIAPDCSDGPYFAMVSRAEYYGRIDA